MTTEVEARDAIVAYLHPAWVTAYPSIKVFYNNTVKVDLDTVGATFLRVSIDFTDSVAHGHRPSTYHCQLWGDHPAGVREGRWWHEGRRATDELPARTVEVSTTQWCDATVPEAGKSSIENGVE
jgi:hypothetical protein